MDHRNIIDSNLSSLVQNIKVKNNVLWEKLVEANIFTSDDVNYIKDTYSAERDQNREILKEIKRSSRESYLLFRQALIDTKQKNVVQQWLPEPLQKEDEIEKVIKKIRVKLAKLYLARHRKIILWKTLGQEVPADFDDMYTELSLVKYNRAANDKESPNITHYTQILKTNPKPQVLVWGEAGTGKSTFCEKFCKDWSLVVMAETEEGRSQLSERQQAQLDRLTEEQVSTLSKLELLIHIVLRKTKANESLEEIICRHLNLKQKLWSNLESFEIILAKSTILFDGIDEMRNEQIDQIVKLEKHVSVSFVVTCRPYVSQDIAFKVETEMRLKGFNKNQSKMYVKLYYALRLGLDCESQEVEMITKSFWKEIESSSDLMEMITNPLMLQLLCFLKHVNPEKPLGRNRSEVFRDYASYLLKQFDRKKERNSEKLEVVYKQELLDAGQLALFGLEQNHFQLIFSRADVLQKAGDSVFEIGFVTDVPGYDHVEFIHYSLMEYLAAYAVVHGPEEKGMESLTNFISTSKRLMRSHMIVSFISTMSKKMSLKVQNKIQDFARDTSDELSPRVRTNFLVAMLRENKYLQFPLPQMVDLDCHEFEIEKWMSWLKLFSQYLRHIPLLNTLFYKFGTTTLQRFLGKNSQGVKTLNIALGEIEKLEVVSLYQTQRAIKSISINFNNCMYEEQHEHLLHLMSGHSTVCELSFSNFISKQEYESQDVFERFVKVVFCFKADLHSLQFSNCQMNSSTYSSILRENCTSLRYLGIIHCDLVIDRNLCELVYKMNQNMQIDLSGNRVEKEKYPSKHLARLLQCFKESQKIDLSECGIHIENKVAGAVARLPGDVELNLSNNVLHKIKDEFLPSVLKCLPQHTNLNLSWWDIKFDAKIIDALSSSVFLQHIEYMNLSHNKMEKDGACRILQISSKAPNLKYLNLQGCDFVIDHYLSELACNSYNQNTLDLSKNKIVKMSPHILSKLIPYMLSTFVTSDGQYNMSCYELYRKMTLCSITTVIDLSATCLFCKAQMETSGPAAISQGSCKAVCSESDKNLRTMEARVIPAQDIYLFRAFDDGRPIRIKEGPDLRTSQWMNGTVIKVKRRSHLTIHLLEAVSKLPLVIHLDLSHLDLSKSEPFWIYIMSLSLIPWSHLQHWLFLLLLFKQQQKLRLSLEKIAGSFYKSQNLTSLNVGYCRLNIDNDTVDAITKLDNLNFLDISGNKIAGPDQEAIVVSIIKLNHYLEVKMENCGIFVNDNIRKHISLLPYNAKLDLSGNQVDHGIFLKILQSDICLQNVKFANCKIIIDKRCAEVTASLLGYIRINLSRNRIMDSSHCVSLMKIQNLASLCLRACGLIIDYEISSAIENMNKGSEVDLSENKMEHDHMLYLIIQGSTKLASLKCCSCAVQITKDVVSVLRNLPRFFKLDISGNTLKDQELSVPLLINAQHLKYLGLKKCGIQIGKAVIEAVGKLPKWLQLDLSENYVIEPNILNLLSTNTCLTSLKLRNNEIQLDSVDQFFARSQCNLEALDLSGNHIRNQSVFHTLIKTFPILSCNHVQYCGVTIDAKIAKLIGHQTQLPSVNLSGNKFEGTEPCLILMKETRNLAELSLVNCGIIIDKEIAEAVSHLSMGSRLDLSNNKILTPHIAAVLVQNANHLASLKLRKCIPKVDKEIAETVSHLNTNLDLDISGNRIQDNTVAMKLMKYCSNLASLSLCDCGIEIDDVMVDIISKLSPDIRLGLSGNKISERVFLTLILKVPHIGLQMQKCGIEINSDIVDLALEYSGKVTVILAGNTVGNKVAGELMRNAKNISLLDLQNTGLTIDSDMANTTVNLPPSLDLNLSGNKVTQGSDCASLIENCSHLKRLNISGCGLQIDSTISESILRLSDNMEVDLSDNKINTENACSCIANASHLKSLALRNCGLTIDKKVAESIRYVSKNVKLDLSGNYFKKMEEPLLLDTILTFRKENQMIDLSGFYMHFTKALPKAVSRLPLDTQLKISGNYLKDKNMVIALINSSHHLSLLDMRGCGISIDKQVAQALSLLPAHTEFDVSGNYLEDEEAGDFLIDIAYPFVDRHICSWSEDKWNKVQTLNFCDYVTMKCKRTKQSCFANYCIDIGEGLYDFKGFATGINKEIVSKLKSLTGKLILSHNKLEENDTLISLLRNTGHMLELDLSHCGITIDDKVVKAIRQIEHLPRLLRLSGNKLENKQVYRDLIINKKSITSSRIILDNCRGVIIDEEVANHTIQMARINKIIRFIGYTFSDKSIILRFLTCKIYLSYLIIVSCGIIIDIEIAQAVSELLPHSSVSLSGNKMENKAACLCLLRNSGHLKSLEIRKSEIDMDTEILDEMFRLSKVVALDVSLNHVLDQDHLVELLELDGHSVSLTMTECGIIIDERLSVALLPHSPYQSVDLSRNKISSTVLFSDMLKKMSVLKRIDIVYCDTEIDMKVSESIVQLQSGTDLYLCGNTFMNPRSCMSLLYNARHLSRLGLSNCNIEINKKIAEAVCQLPENVELDLSSNMIPDKDTALYLIKYWHRGKVLSLENCGILIDEDIKQALIDRKKYNITFRKNTVSNSDILSSLILRHPATKKYMFFKFSVGQTEESI